MPITPFKPLPSLPLSGIGSPRPSTPGPSSSLPKPKPLSSISHLHDADQRPGASAGREVPRTSIFDRPTAASAADNEDEQITEYLREKFVAKRMKEKRMAEAAGQTPGQKTAYDMDVKTGASFRTTGTGSFKKQLGRQVKSNRSSLGNLSAKDKKFFSNLIEGHAKRKMTGQEFTRIDRVNMRKEVTQAWKAGTISSEDKKDFHKMIKGL